jgi:hypothetical protein
VSLQLTKGKRAVPVWVRFASICFACSNSSFATGIGISAFLDLTGNSILLKTKSLQKGPREISGAVVKRQQRKKEEGDDDEEEAGTLKKKRKTKQEKVSVPATPADAAKDTAEKFEYILRRGIEDAQKQNPGKVVVVLVDGGGPHTVEPFLSLRPSNLGKKEIEAHLRDAGLWPKCEKVSAKEARRIYTDSPIPRSQWTNAELIALELGAILIYIPLNHPQLNVIEQVWRAIKQRYRGLGTKNLATMLKCVRDCLTGANGAEEVCSERKILKRKMRTDLIARHLMENPEADALSENKLRGKKFRESPGVDVSEVPKFGKSLVSKEDLLDAQLYAHYLNQARLKQYRKGEVFVFVFTVLQFDLKCVAVHGSGQAARFRFKKIAARTQTAATVN